MDTAIIEFNSLPDAVRPAAENHDLAFAALAVLVLVAVGRIIVRRVSFELSGACIDQAVSGKYPRSFAFCAECFFRRPFWNRKLSVGKSQFLGALERCISIFAD